MWTEGGDEEESYYDPLGLLASLRYRLESLTSFPDGCSLTPRHVIMPYLFMSRLMCTYLPTVPCGDEPQDFKASTLKHDPANLSFVTQMHSWQQ